MEATTLSLRNCHRAITVRLKAAPEKGEWKWSWHGKSEHSGFFSETFYNIATNIATGESVEVKDIDLTLQEWEAVEWAYDMNLERLYEQGVRAFSGTSHVPEQRSMQYIRMYETLLLSDLEKIPEAEREAYYDKFKNWVGILFSKQSSILSPMITGPARFNNRRNTSANNAYDKAVEDFNKWRENYAKGVLSRIEAAKTPEQRAAEEWENFRKELLPTMSSIVDIDEGRARGYNRALFVSSLYGKIERKAHNGQSALVVAALDYIKEYSARLRKPIFTPRHKVWKLAETCKWREAVRKKNAERESAEFPVEGGTIVVNYAENRLQIVYDEKPSAAVRDSLKKCAFHWAPSEGAWQRQLTTSAISAAVHVLFGSDDSEPKKELSNKLYQAL